MDTEQIAFPGAGVHLSGSITCPDTASACPGVVLIGGSGPSDRHNDGFFDALTLTIRAGQLPTANGVTATILLTTTAENFYSGHGLVITGHGATIPVAQAREFAGQARFMGVIFDKAGRVEAHTSTRRFFTEGQRLAMQARDLGCSFPGCTAPAAWAAPVGGMKVTWAPAAGVVAIEPSDPIRIWPPPLLSRSVGFEIAACIIPPRE